MNKFPKLSAVVGLLLLAAAAVSAGNAQPQEVQAVLAAARDGVTQFLSKIPVGSEASFGFNSRAEFDNVGLGTPIAVVTVVPESINTVRTDQELFVSVNEWRVPVLVGGEMRALLTVAKVGGAWKAVDFGASGLAVELGQFMKDKATEMSGRTLELLRLYQLHSDFLVLADPTLPAVAENIYPLKSASMMLARNGQAVQSVYSKATLLPLLQEDFRREAQNEK